MTDVTIQKELVKLGLTEKEALVYLILLELGNSSVEDISSESGVNRSSVYPILESLCSKTLVNKSPTIPFRYTASTPDILLEEVSTMRKKQLRTQNIVDSLLPELNRLMRPLNFKPRIRFFEGLEGLKTADYELHLIPKHEEVRVFSPSGSWHHFLAQKNIRVISSYEKTPDNQLTSAENTIIRLLPKTYAFASEVRIYGTTIVLMSHQEQFAVLVDNDGFAKVMKETFDLAWEEAGRLTATKVS